jgi:hypothetical protein
MTNKELINYLKTFPENAKIVTKSNHDIIFNTWDFQYDDTDNTIYIIS